MHTNTYTGRRLIVVWFVIAKDRASSSTVDHSLSRNDGLENKLKSLFGRREGGGCTHPNGFQHLLQENTSLRTGSQAVVRACIDD
jgi:hypothetical protein